MSIRSTTKARQGVLAVVMAAALAVAVTGCGDGEGRKSESQTSPQKTSSKQPVENKPSAEGVSEEPDVVLAEVKGDGGVVLKITGAKRDGGGFVTVSGAIRNESDLARNTAAWAGSEPAISRFSPNSVAGATLVDKVGKKRYYVLRDTDGRCLCSTRLVALQPGKEIGVFMQFPAPPEGTNEVDFTLPTFATATIQISG
ncbi:hypothetical protein [Streptomyces sp. NBC_00239]|uniref:hypothetical protein n=1 Tax=Streptomyces sp. NBC_00239 TaxID=2903640 RepID=UPI002E28C702|nr:hypothetical protein [Streptomyces sp. NBC_00239]